jgi:hypothetical protein
MKRDIRDLFKEEDDFKSLLDNHRTEFFEKLKKQPEKKSTDFPWLKIVAVFLVTLTVGFSLFFIKPEDLKVSPIIAQVEAEYLKNIETEWQQFLTITNDTILIKRFEKKLNELDVNYKEIAIEFKGNTNNIIVIEALVDNLQTRLQILKDIQAHIKILNQNNEPYENTI